MTKCCFIASLFALLCVSSRAAQPPTASKIFDELRKTSPDGLTREEVIVYLRKYDPRFNVPEYIAFARSHPAFKKVMDRLIDQAADDIMTSGVGAGTNPNVLPNIIPKKDFIARVNKSNPNTPKEPAKDYLADVSKFVLERPGLVSDKNLSIAKIDYGGRGYEESSTV